MKYFFSSTFLAALFITPLTIFAQAEGWQLKKEADGITVYTRSVENTNINEFKASTKLNASSETIFKIILDVENYPKWIVDVNYAERIYHRNSQIGMYYQLGMPWPIKDRDITLISKYRKLPGNSILFQLSYNSELKEVDDNFVRITEINGEWLIKPIDEENCEVLYRFLADPGGYLPAWVVNIFIVEGPFITMQNLKAYSATLTQK